MSESGLDTDRPGAIDAAMQSNASVAQALFDTLPDGRPVHRWTLRSPSGAGLTIMALGATILTLDIPDRHGAMADVVLGFDRAGPYLTDSPYFGAVVGRYANRIARGHFVIDGSAYSVSVNNGVNALHAGPAGFDTRMWRGEMVETADGRGVMFTIVSADGDEGFPGEVSASVTYVWTDDHRLIVDFAATATRPTPFNIAQHSYWNLNGADGGATILDHLLSIDADRFTPVDETQIPTGELAPVDGSPFDFRAAKPVGRDIDRDDAQLAGGGGYDHNWVLNGDGMRAVAILTDPASGRRMTLSTTEPGLQVFSGNFGDRPAPGKRGAIYRNRSGIALETQHFPDSPNQPHFPDTILRPGQRFGSRTIFAFDTIG